MTIMKLVFTTPVHVFILFVYVHASVHIVLIFKKICTASERASSHPPPENKAKKASGKGVYSADLYVLKLCPNGNMLDIPHDTWDCCMDRSQFLKYIFWLFPFFMLQMILQEDSHPDKAPVLLYSIDLEVEFLDHGAFLGIAKLLLKVVLPMYSSTCKHLNSSHPCLHLVISDFMIFAKVMDVKWYLTGIFICMFSSTLR